MIPTTRHPTQLKIKAVSPDPKEKIDDDSSDTTRLFFRALDRLDQHATTNPSLFSLAHRQLAAFKNEEPLQPICLQTCRDFLTACSILDANEKRFISLKRFDRYIDDAMRIWETESGTCIRTLKGHTDRIICTALTSDGKLLASGSCDQTIKIWDTESGTCIHTLKGHTDRVNVIAFAPDEKSIVSGSNDETIRIWDIKSGKESALNWEKRGSIDTITFTPDGKRFVAASSMSPIITISNWPPDTSDLKTLQEETTGNISNIALAPNGETLASSSNGIIKIWEIKSGKRIHTLNHVSNNNGTSITDHFTPISIIIFALNGDRLISGSINKINIWKTESGICIHTLEKPMSCFALSPPIALTPDSKRLIVGLDNKDIEILDIESGICIDVLEGREGPIDSIKLTPDGKRLISGSPSRSLTNEIFKTWDLYPLPEKEISLAQSLEEISENTLPKIGEYLHMIAATAERNDGQIDSFGLSAIPFTIERIKALPDAIQKEIYAQIRNSNYKAIDMKGAYTTAFPPIEDSVKRFFSRINKLRQDLRDPFYKQLETEAQKHPRPHTRNILRATSIAIGLIAGIAALFTFYRITRTPSIKSSMNTPRKETQDPPHKQVSVGIQNTLPEKVEDTSPELLETEQNAPQYATRNILRTASIAIGLIAGIAVLFTFLRITTALSIGGSVKQLFSRAHKLPKQIQNIFLGAKAKNIAL